MYDCYELHIQVSVGKFQIKYGSQHFFTCVKYLNLIKDNISNIIPTYYM